VMFSAVKSLAKRGGAAASPDDRVRGASGVATLEP
jgi:hypothetical protein